MLDSITIKNFKAIGDPGLTLNGLTNVNYLVGKNGCGKSSVLEMVKYSMYAICHRDIVTIHTGYSNEFKEGFEVKLDFKKTDLEFNKLKSLKSSQISFEILLNLTNQFNFQVWSDNILSVNPSIRNLPYLISEFEKFTLSIRKVAEIYTLALGSNSKSLDPIAFGNLQIPASSDDKTEFMDQFNSVFDTEYITIGDDENFYRKKNIKVETKKLSGGQKSWITFYQNLVLSCQSYKIICIEEPETTFHPELQKSLPKIFQTLSEKYKVQFFISTHSPFIISAAAKIAEEEKLSWDSSKGAFEPSQKVYQIESSKCVKPEGVWGYKAVSSSAKMLGAGLVDLQSPQDSINKDSPLIILCEGVNAEEDSKFYNTLFKYEARHSMFISAQGEAQLFYNYLYFLSVKDEISANFEIVSLKDRDNKFASIEDIKNEVELKPGLKYTYKRAKELYIYNEETMNYFRDAKKTKIISEKKKVFDAEIIRIEDKTNAKESCSYKGIKGKWLDLFETKIDPKEITETKIAEIIRNNKDTSEIYKELHDLIFK